MNAIVPELLEQSIIACFLKVYIGTLQNPWELRQLNY